MAFPRNEARRARIAELHAQGLNDHQIAAAMGIPRLSAREVRVAMKLPAHCVGRPSKTKPLPPTDRFLAAFAKAGVVCPRPKNTTNTVRAA